MLAIRQQRFGIPSADVFKIDEILNNPLTVINNTFLANDKTNGNFFLFPDIHPGADFIRTIVAIKPSDLSSKATIHISNTVATLNKAAWENFWLLYNLIQEYSSCNFSNKSG